MTYIFLGQPLYVILYAAAIIFFRFFYTGVGFNPRDTADNLKKSGAFIPGIRPGEQTSRYIDKVMTRLTLAGALYITFVCLVPEFMIIGLERAVLLAVHRSHYRSSHHGLYGTGTDSYDVSSI